MAFYLKNNQLVESLGNRRKAYDLNNAGVRERFSKDKEAGPLIREWRAKKTAPIVRKKSAEYSPQQHAQELLQTKMNQLILPNNYSTMSLSDDVLVDLYERSAAQASGDKVFHHPGEEKLDANMLTRFFTSNLNAELVADKLSKAFPNAQAEVRARDMRELNRNTDGGSDIAGLPVGKEIDIKYVAGSKPSNVTARVGNQLRKALDRGDDSLLSFYQQKGGYISNEDLRNIDTMLNRFNRNPQQFKLRGHVKASDFIDNATRRRLDSMREPQYVLPQEFTHGDNQALIDYLMDKV
jgi:hypothetical protein